MPNSDGVLVGPGPVWVRYSFRKVSSLLGSSQCLSALNVPIMIPKNKINEPRKNKLRLAHRMTERHDISHCCKPVTYT
jgi:hypothetical protein